MLAYLGLQSALLAVRYDLGSHLAGLSVLAAFEDAHDGGLVLAAGSGDLAGFNVIANFTGLSTGACLIRFDAVEKLVD